MTYKYSSNRSALIAKNVVATSQPLAAQAGLSMLKAGGNAIDAAIATAICLTVVEPTSNGIGGDGFAIFWDGNGLKGYNGSGKSPKAWHHDRFKDLKSLPDSGWECVTVPGLVKTWVDLSEKFGRLPFEKLFEPAINYAENGFFVSSITAYYWALATKKFNQFEGFKSTFTNNGLAPKEGELFINRDQANTLKEIANTKGKSFYEGEIASKIIADSEAHGGVMTLEDLKSHSGFWVDPISSTYQNNTLHEIPPNGQGIAALIAVGILNHLSLEKYPVDSLESVHLQIEAMKIAFKELFEHNADPEYIKVDPKKMLTEEYFKNRASKIKLGEAKDFSQIDTYSPGTVYLTAADQEGMMVSFIQSNYTGFGSGIVVPDTGIAMQNRGLGFVLDKNHPNVVAGSKRPFHTIIPGFVTRNGRPLMSFGVMGAHMQAQGHTQMMVRIFTYQQNPQEALDAPRWHVTETGEVGFESDFDSKIIEGLKSLGHKISNSVSSGSFGGGQIILKNNDGYICGSDKRKDGCAVGY